MSEPTALPDPAEADHDPDEISFPTERERAVKSVVLGVGLGLALVAARGLNRRRRSA